jgi:hypothetical protein
MICQEDIAEKGEIFLSDLLTAWFTDGGLSERAATAGFLALNAETEEYGLALTPGEAAELAQTRRLALEGSGRLEMGGGAPEEIIRVFSRSEYLYPHNYARTLNEITEAFYALKNETLDAVSDRDLIAFLFERFEREYRGDAAALLDGRELEKLVRSLKFGPEDEPDEEESEEEDE